jgi:hypothetical protein
MSDLRDYREAERVAAYIRAALDLAEAQITLAAKPARFGLWFNPLWACYCAFWMGHDVSEGHYGWAALMAVIAVLCIVLTVMAADANARLTRRKGKAEAILSSYSSVRAHLAATVDAARAGAA